MIKVDVIVPVFNGAQFVNRALESLKTQTYTPNKVIVVDDGSEDNSLEVIKVYLSKMPNLVIFPESHKGLSATRNIGITSSTADFIAFLDCDDYWSPTKLENQVKHLENHSDCGAVFSNCNINDETNGRTYQAKNNGIEIFSDRNLLTQKYRVMGSASSICIRRTILEQVGIFDESKFYGEDYDLWVRISKVTRICELHNRDVYITKRKDSMQSSNERGLASFKNTLVYFMVWSEHTEILKSEKRAFEKLIFPDMARAVFRNPLDLIRFFRHISQKYDSIHEVIFPRRFSITLFLFRNTIWYLMHGLNSKFRRILE